MDFINPENEENLTPAFINNSIEENNEETNPERELNILDNNFSFNNKVFTFFKTIDKNSNGNIKEEKEHNNLINNNKDNLNLSEITNNKVSISSKVNDLKKENKEKLKKKSGRKKSNNTINKNMKEHNKYSDDNIRRKCKHLVLKNTLQLINEKIFIMYGGNIGNGIFKKELHIINKNQKSDATVVFEKNFLHKKLGEIFSENLSARYTNFPSFHNKRLILSLLNEKDQIKKKYFTDLFNITFLDCLKHFRGEKYINELGGLNCFENDKEKILDKCGEDGDDYVETLKYYLDNFEKIVNRKKPRKLRKKLNNNFNISQINN
jgi:hypothetical protein